MSKCSCLPLTHTHTQQWDGVAATQCRTKPNWIEQYRTEQKKKCPGWQREEFHYYLSAAFPHSSHSRILCAGYKCTWITKRGKEFFRVEWGRGRGDKAKEQILCACGLCLWQDQRQTLAANCERATLQILIRQKHATEIVIGCLPDAADCHLQLAPICKLLHPFLFIYYIYLTCYSFWFQKHDLKNI